TTRTEFPYPTGKEALQRGKTYHWTVKAIKRDGKTETVVERTDFTIASKELEKELAELPPLLKTTDHDTCLLAAPVFEREASVGKALPLYEMLGRERPRQANLLRALRDLYYHYDREKAIELNKRLKELGYEN